MADQLAFQLDLTGNFASALAPVNAGLAHANDQLTKAGKVGKSFLDFTGKAAAAGEKLGGGTGGRKWFDFEIDGSIGKLAGLLTGAGVLTFGLAEAGGKVLEVFKAIGEAAVRVVEKVAEISKEMLKTAADTQDLNLAVKLDVGEANAAAIDRMASGFESTSRFDAGDIKTALLPLMEQGVKDERLLNDMATAATDIAARRKGGAAEVQSALDAFGRIALKGEVDARALRQLAVGEADFFRDLGSLLGVSAKQAEELSKAGKVKSQTLLSVALNQVAERQGGSLGMATMAAGENLNGTWARFARLPDQYFEKLASSPALDRLAKALGRALEALDPDSPTGARISAAIDTFIDKIADFVDTLTTGNVFDTIVGGIGQFADGVRVGIGLVTEFVGVLKKLADIATATTAPLRAVMGYVDRATGGDKQQQMIDDWATKLQQGYSAGLIDSTQLQSIIDSMSDDVKARFKERMGIHSPSRVFEEYGRQTAAGFALGLEGGAAMVDAASRRGLADAAFGSAPAAGASPARGGGNVFHLEVNIDGTDLDRDELQAAIEQAATTTFHRLLADVGDATGTAEAA